MTGFPGSLAAEHYAQRATFGLIVSEGTLPPADGHSCPVLLPHGWTLSPAIWDLLVELVNGAACLCPMKR